MRCLMFRSTEDFFAPRDFEALLRGARAGDRDALGRLLLPYERFLTREALARLDHGFQAKADVGELVQETCVRATGMFRQFRGQSPGEWWTWLKRILDNLVINTNKQLRHGR